MKKIIILLFASFLMSINSFTQGTHSSEKNELMKFKKNLSTGLAEKNINPAIGTAHATATTKADPADYGNPPDWPWVKTYGGSGKDVARKVAVASDGSFYVTGSFSGEIGVGQNNYNCVGKRDAFLAKYQSDGTLLWFHQFSPLPGENIDAYDIKLDSVQNIYFTGYYTGDVSFGDFNLPGTHDKNLYLVKTNSDGEVSMAVTHQTSNSQELGLKVDTDHNGNIFVLGSTDGTTGFWHQSVIIKYAPDGSLLSDYYNDQCFADMQVFENHIYFVATLNSTGYVGNFFLELSAYNDAFVAKSDLDLNFDWVEKATHTNPWNGDSRGTALYVSADEEIYFTGTYRSNVFWDTIEVTGASAYVAKCSSDGNFLWAKNLIDEFNVNPTDIDGNDNVAFVSFSVGAGLDVAYQIDGYDMLYGTKALTKDFEYNVESIKNSFTDNSLLITQDQDQLIRLASLDNNSLNTNWVNSFSGTSAQSYGIGMGVDNDEFFYNYGYASNQLDYFGQTINKGLFLAKQWGTGDVKWIVQFSEAEPVYNDIGNYLVVDTNSNSVYITGGFYKPFVIPDGPVLPPNSSGDGSIFILKYDLDGNLLWAQKEDVHPAGLSLAVDNAGNVLLTGLFNGVVTVGGTELTSTGADDVFIVKYDSNGDAIWSKRAGGEDEEDIGLVSTDGNNNVYLTGEFYSINVTVGNYPITLNDGDGNILLAKLNPQGVTQWVTAKGGGRAGDPIADYYGWPTGIHTDINGYSYVKGWHSDSAYFDNIVLTSALNKPENMKRWNKFVARFDPDGNTVWASTISELNPSIDYNQFDVDKAGNVYYGLIVKDTIVFGDHDYTYVNTGNRGLVVVKYDNNGDLDWVKSIESSASGNAWLNSVVAFNEQTTFVGGWFTNYLDFGSTSFVVNNQTGFIGLLGEPLAVTIYKQHDKSLVFKLFPNPAQQQINIQLKDKLKSEANLLITDVTGRQIFSKNIIPGNSTIPVNVSKLDAGVYFITLKSEKLTAVKKFVVE